jgi:very-short-patch-repair endonuclease
MATRVQVPLHDQRGRFLGRPDLYYPEHKLGLEYDGGAHRDNLVEDNRRQNRLLGGGIRLLRFTAADIYGTPESVIEQVRRATSNKTIPSPHT